MGRAGKRKGRRGNAPAVRPASTVERGSRIRLAAIRSAIMGVLPILAIFLGARVRGAPMFV